MEKKSFFYGWWIVIGGVLMLSTMVPVVSALANKYLIHVTEDMGITRTSFSFLSTIFSVVCMLVLPFASKKLAKGNVRRIQCVGVICFCLAYFCYSFAKNIYHMYMCAVVIGIAFSFSTMIPVSMMIINWFVKKRGLAMSIAMTGIGVGGFVFSPLVTFFLEQYGWRLTYRIMAIIVFAVSFPVAAFILRARPEDSGLKPYGAEEAGQGAAKNKEARSMPPTGITLTVKESYSKMFFWLLLAGMFFCGILSTGSLGQFPPAIQGMHGAVVQATIISLYSFFGIFAKLVLGWLNDRFGMIVSTLVGGVAFMLTFVLMLFGENLTLLYIMAFFFGFGISVPAVLPPLLVSSIFGSKNYGDVYGLTTSTMNLGSAMGSLIVAQIFDRTGSYSMGWLLLMVVVVLTVICWMSSYLGSKQYFAENNIPA